MGGALEAPSQVLEVSIRATSVVDAWIIIMTVLLVADMKGFIKLTS